MLTPYKRQIAEFIGQNADIRVGSYVLTTDGRSSTYYFDTGAFGRGRQLVQAGRYLSSEIELRVPEEADALYGPPDKGIPLAIATAMQRDMSYIVKRQHVKSREGQKGFVIGCDIMPDMRVGFVDNVISLGGSIQSSINFLKELENNLKFPYAVVMVDRQEAVDGESAVEIFKKEYNIKVIPLLTITECMEAWKDKPEQNVPQNFLQAAAKHLLQYGTDEAKAEVERLMAV